MIVSSLILLIGLAVMMMALGVRAVRAPAGGTGRDPRLRFFAGVLFLFAATITLAVHVSYSAF